MKNSITKIKLNKSDEVAVVVEKIIDAQNEELVLEVPRFSRLAESQANFHLIAREAGLLNRRVTIESVDDKALAMAEAEGLTIVNPILARPKKTVSDIVSGGEARGVQRKIKTGVTKRVRIVSQPEVPIRKIKEEVPIPRRTRIRVGKKHLVVIAACALVLIALGILAFRILPRVSITLVRQRVAWDYRGSYSVERRAGTAQIFSAERNLTLTFPASGTKEVSRQARGTLIIYNAYSSDPQPLVAQTRFQTADGKVFRLAKSIVVPAAKITEGKIQPSTIEAEAIADKAGAEYNIGPVPYLSVPGFRGTPKYQGFYGEIRTPFSGGFVGTLSVPTSGDITKAKKEVVAKLEAALVGVVATEIPADFKMLEGSREFRVRRETVTEEADAAGNFSVTTEGVMRAIAFRETAVVAAMKEKMRKELGETREFLDYTLEYAEPRTNFDTGSLSFTLAFKSSVVQPIDEANIQARIRGMHEEDLRAALLAVPGLERADIAFSLFWVRRVPKNQNRITIDIK